MSSRIRFSPSGYFGWKGGLLWIPVLLLAVVILGPLGAEAERGTVQQVFDGDTILLHDGRRVRYLGINAPEYQEPFSLKAKRFNEKLVLGKEIRLEFDEEQSDGHGRLLAYVYAGDQFVNARLVEGGLAHAFFIAPNRKHRELLLRLQAEAKRKRLGMWSARGGAQDLKITSVRPARPDDHDPQAPYVRVTSLSDGSLSLRGYVLSNERGDRFVFPDLTIEPGETVVISGADESRGLAGSSRQPVLAWPQQQSVWDPKEDTAFLFSPGGVLVDRFHYKGKRVSGRGRGAKKRPR